ncbi:hypothetical protein T492DRAFT_879754 [Pavlovales sp. CCMP2436]|nr:hypothetical protein T492DRAFT_879754 [Pavlovales sp. CCMP2436]
MAAPNPSAAGTGYTRLETPRSLSFAVVAAAERGRHLLSPPAGTPPGSRPKSNNGTSRRGGLSVASLDHPNRDVDGDRPVRSLPRVRAWAAEAASLCPLSQLISGPFLHLTSLSGGDGIRVLC